MRSVLILSAAVILSSCGSHHVDRCDMTGRWTGRGADGRAMVLSLSTGGRFLLELTEPVGTLSAVTASSEGTIEGGCRGAVATVARPGGGLPTAWTADVSREAVVMSPQGSAPVRMVPVVSGG